MPSVIKIKRSTTAGAPSSLSAGELAYSFADPTNVQGGSRLFIGDGSNITVIGGKYFTDLLDHSAGTLTASSAIITDSFNKIDQLNVDNLTLNNNTISTTNTNGDLTLSPNGTGLIDFYGNYTFPRADGTAGYVLTTDGNGVVEWQPSAASLTVGDDASATTTIDLLSETLSVLGGEGIDTAITDNTITISAEDATDTNKGIASFDATNFTVTSGDVVANDITLNGDTGSAAASIGESFTFTGGEGIDTSATGTTITITAEDATDTNKGIASFDATDFTVTSGAVTLNAERIEDIAGAMVSGTGADQTNIDVAYDDTNGKFTFSVDTATDSVLGVASFDSTNFTVNGGAVSANDITIGTTALTIGETTTSLSGLQQLDVDNITINGNEISSTDTDGNISLNPDGNGTVDLNSTRITSLADPVNPQDAATKAYVDAARSGLDVKQSVRVATTANITLSNTQTVDGVALNVGDRVLVKDQTDPIENGLYVVSLTGWTRAADADEPNEVSAGLFVFVEEGSTNADSGFVLTSDNPMTVGTDALEFVQFSGAGQIVAGDGLSKSGNTLSVNVANGLEISGDNVQIASSAAGDGLTYASGVLDIVGTNNRISVNTNSIDISASYVGQSSITTLGTVTTGTWNADVIGPAYGGTGKSSYNAFDLLVGNAATGLATLALGSAGKVLQVNDAGNALVYGDLDGGVYA
jgi:hypothetical protein